MDRGARALGVEFGAKRIEATLPGPQTCRRWSRGFGLQGAMHALVARGDWVDLGGADEQKLPKEGTDTLMSMLRRQ